MNNVMYQTQLLNRELKGSEEYHHYLSALERLKENEELYEKTKSFINRNFQLQSLADYNTIDEVAKLRLEYEDVLMNPIVAEFLGAEQRILALLRRVENGMLDGIRLDMSAIAEWEQ